jgi:hypothetical protein
VSSGLSPNVWEPVMSCTRAEEDCVSAQAKKVISPFSTFGSIQGLSMG